jgi:phage I-like protein
MTERMQDRALECQSVGTPEVGDGLKQLRLSPWGKVESTNGDFIVDDEGVREVLRTFAEHGAALPIDVEHETLPERQPATGSRGAIGWIEKVFAETGKGLFALVKWGDAGKALILSDAFRYLSPVFLIRKDDRRVVGLHSAAITNKPALFKVERLAASQNARTETETMTMERNVSPIITELAGLIGMPVKSDTTGTAVLTACRDKLKALAADDAVAIAQSVRHLLQLSATASKNEVIVALTTRDESGASVELSTMRQAERERLAKACVDKYVQAMVINPNHPQQYAAAVALAQEDPAKLDALLARAKPWVEPGRTNAPTGRQTVVALAEREFRSNPAHGRSTSLQAFVANALREKSLSRLTEAEMAELAVG